MVNGPLEDHNKNMEEKKSLTFKQREWLQFYMEDGNATRAALKAYYPDFPIDKPWSELNEEERKTYNAAKNIGWENLTIRDIPIQELLDEAGLGDSYLVKVLSENLQATRLFGKNAIRHMDGSTRNKALEIALKLKDKLKDRVEIEGGFFSAQKMEIEVVHAENQDERQTALDTPTTE